jgi:monofunctional biosynthetic peptidoglycan transglycosylase
MLPAPKRFEAQPQSAYLLSRSAAIQARMGDVQIPR